MTLQLNGQQTAQMAMHKRTDDGQNHQCYGRNLDSWPFNLHLNF